MFSEVQNPLGGKDFGTVLVTTSTSVTADAREPKVTPSSHQRQNTVNRVTPPSAVPVPSATSLSVRTPTPAPVHGRFPLVLSSRENVGFPDYTHHPSFVRPGPSRIRPEGSI